MKKTIATTLSIIGVLGAGSVAALVNTQVLSSGPSEATASAALLPAADEIDLTVPTLATLPVITTRIDLQAGARATDATSSTSTTLAEAPLVESTSTTTVAPPPPAPVAPSRLTAFNVGDSGIVTVDVVNGKLIIVNTQPSAGWTVTGSEERTDNSIRVTFASATIRVKFTAVFADDQIVPSVESESIPAPTTTAATPPSSGYNDDDYDDEYESDDSHDDDGDDEDERDDD